MLDNLTMGLVFTNVDIESPPIDTPLFIYLTRCLCIVMSKILLKYSTDQLVRPYMSYVSASIVFLFMSDRLTLQDINFRFNSATF